MVPEENKVVMCPPPIQIDGQTSGSGNNTNNSPNEAASAPNIPISCQVIHFLRRI